MIGYATTKMLKGRGVPNRTWQHTHRDPDPFGFGPFERRQLLAPAVTEVFPPEPPAPSLADLWQQLREVLGEQRANDTERLQLQRQAVGALLSIAAHLVPGGLQ